MKTLKEFKNCYTTFVLLKQLEEEVYFYSIPGLDDCIERILFNIKIRCLLTTYPKCN